MINVRTIKQAIWKNAMEKSDDIRIKYASKYAQSSNYWKNSIGMNQAVKELKVIEKKQALERQLQEWIRREPDKRSKYARVLTELELNYRNRRNAARAMAYFGETFANGPELITAALAVLNFDFEAEESDLERNMRQLLEIYANMDISVDKQVFVAMLKEYAAEVGKEFLPDVYPLIEKDFKGDYQAYVDDLYARSSLKTPHGFEQVVKGDTTYVLFDDPAASFAIDMLVKFYEFNQSVEEASMNIEKNERLLNEAMREMEADRVFYPDANSTMRLSFGMVGGTGLEQQRRRPPPAAETGSRGWDSVLIFQSPAKGLRKNQQTQPVQAPAVRFRQGSQRLGMSTGMTAVLWWAVQDENRNEQRQGITMVVVSCLLLFLIEYGILGSVQQICIWRIESCGMN